MSFPKPVVQAPYRRLIQFPRHYREISVPAFHEREAVENPTARSDVSNAAQGVSAPGGRTPAPNHIVAVSKAKLIDHEPPRTARTARLSTFGWNTKLP